MAQALPGSPLASPSANIRRLELNAPWRWLQLGWRDLRHAPIASLAYGLLFALAGDLILLLALPYPHLFSLAVSGFFLVAPLLAAGLYEISRRHEQGQSSTFIDSLNGWRRNGQSIALLGIVLMLATIVWERLSAILFALLYTGAGGIGSGMTGFVRNVVLSGEHTGFVAVWFIAGGLLASIVFALAAVSVPMLLDRDNDAGGDLVSALGTSLRAVAKNPGAMALWAFILVVGTLTGFATFLFGLIILMPLLGHATWHAYREVVEPLQ